MLMLNVPATVGLVVLAAPIVRVIFEHGRFTPPDTLATAAALQFYAIGLVGYSVVRIASPTFYALGQNRTPVVVSVITVLVNAALNIALVRVMGYRGLALGTSIAALFNATLLFVLLRRASTASKARLLASRSPHRHRVGGDGRCALVVTDRLAARCCPHGAAVQIVRSAQIIGAAVACCRRRMAAANPGVQRGMGMVLRRFRRRRNENVRHRSACTAPSCCWRRRTSSSTATATSSRRCCRCSSRNSTVARGAGTLQMCFQLANSVAQLASATSPTDGGRGCCSSPVRCSAVSCCRSIGLAPTPSGARGGADLGGLGGAAFHPPAAALVHQHSGSIAGLRCRSTSRAARWARRWRRCSLRRSSSDSGCARRRGW